MVNGEWREYGMLTYDDVDGPEEYEFGLELDALWWPVPAWFPVLPEFPERKEDSIAQIAVKGVSKSQI